MFRFLVMSAFLLSQLIMLGNDTAPLREALAKQAQHRSVSVKFRQTKNNPALTDEIKTMGQLWLIPGKSFRWQLGSPKKKTVLYDGTTVFVLDEAKKTGSRLSPTDRKIKPLLLTLGIGKEASFDGLTKSFTISATNQDKERYVARMIPKSRRLRRAIRSLLMQVNTKTSFPERIGWTQRDGTTVMTEFFTPTLSKPLPKRIFMINESEYTWE